MKIDISIYCEGIAEHYDEEQKHELYESFDSLSFKLKRNLYHLENIQGILKNATDLDNNNYYEEVYMPIYFEIECFLVSIRSSVDMLLHLTNYVFDLELSSLDTTLHSVYHHKKLPKMVKNIFDRYTRPYKNETWTFIYSSRNEVVHEKSVHQVLPISIDTHIYDQPTIFFSLGGKDKDLLTYFNNCIRFLETFVSQLLSSIEVASKRN